MSSQRRRGVIADFVRERCVLDRDGWIDLEERFGPDGTLKPGFRPELWKFCKKEPPFENREGPVLQYPTLRGLGWARALPLGVNFRDRSRVKQERREPTPSTLPKHTYVSLARAQVYGFSWKKAPSISDTMTPKFVALEALAVFLHLAVFCGLSLGPIFYALAMQVPSERPRVACAAVV